MKKVFLTLTVLCMFFYSCKEAKANDVDEIEEVTAEEVKTHSQPHQKKVIQLNNLNFDASDDSHEFSTLEYGEGFEDELAKVNINKPLSVKCGDTSKFFECEKLLEAHGFIKVLEVNEGVSHWIFDPALK